MLDLRAHHHRRSLNVYDGSTDQASVREYANLTAMQKPLRLLIIINHLAEGGAAVIAIEEAQQLALQGVDVTICTIYTVGRLAHTLHDYPIKIIDLAISPDLVEGEPGGKYNVSIPFRLAAIIRQGYDIIHVHNFPASYMAAAASLLTPRLPYIFTEHNAHNRRRERAVFKLADKWAYSRYTRIIAVSQPVHDALTAWLPQAAAKTVTLPNAIRTEAFQISPAERQAFRQSLGLDDHSVLFIFAGRFIRAKGLDVLVEAVALLPDDLPFHVLLVGSGVEEAALRQQIADYQLSDRIRLLGFRDDIPQLMAAADVLLLPSRWEGLPMVLLEAMAAQNAIIATATSGIVDVVEHGKMGLLIPPDDAPALAEAMQTLLDDRAMLAAFGRAGQAHVTQAYAIDQHTQRLLQIYQDAEVNHA